MLAHLLHYFNTICQRPKNGTFGYPGKPRPGRGTMRPKYGMSREIHDGWQPYISHMSLASSSLSVCQGQSWTLINIVADSNHCAYSDFVAVVDYTTSYELAVLSVFLQLIHIDAVV